MTGKELPHVSPESLGISSRSILKFVRDLEESGTEMHGFMILRHGRIAAKGWWNPFAPGLIHGSQSLTKTVTGAAYGIAEKEGILNLEVRLIDIFPEYAGETSGPYWDQLKMRHILTMSAGMVSQPDVTDPDWKRNFFHMEIVHKPGTSFFYNSIACSMVGACITRKTGLGLREYLTPRLFHKIGIDGSVIRWYRHGDGSENGSGGIVTTTEDNARLMQLFLQGGTWEGEQIISENWARTAVKLQNDQFRLTFPDVPQDQGYGGMMWIRGGNFYADGAMGQLAVGFPEQDMVISLNQTISSPDADRKMKAVLFGFGSKVYGAALPDDAEGLAELERKCACLALPAPACSPDSPAIPFVNGRRCRIKDGHAAFFAEDIAIFNRGYHDEVYAFSFLFSQRLLKLTVESESGMHTVLAGLDGRRFTNHAEGNIPVTEALLSAYWKDADTLSLEIRWLESCRSRSLSFRFESDGVHIVSELKPVGGFDIPPMEAFAVWEDKENIVK
ncbi:MAG TPA: serine hydrolase [Clostridia bacterium]|nr:serine hydrolase [Clostridia bacterium]